jgi:hypothetical protein
MIPDRDRTFTTTSNVTGEDVRMGIHVDATAHLMGVLTELYEDAEYAVIREYATNARDSHVQAGELSRAIEVTTPSELSPVFKVRDYGVGLDLEDIRAIYSQYGASTKRNTNDAVGMLGLGCKSALAYTAAFTLRAIKDGHAITVNVARDDEGGGTMTVLDQAGTSDEDGVEVLIPAPRSNEIDRKAREFFRHWEPGTVLLDGEDPSGYGAGAIELSDDLTVIEDEFNGYTEDRHRVVMGNVAYPAYLRGVRLPREVMGNVAYPAYLRGVRLPRDRSLIARVPIGTVQFTPSREALMDTPKNREVLNDIAERFVKLAGTAVQTAVDAADSRAAALAAHQATNSALGTRAPATWRGEDVPASVARPAGGILHVPPHRYGPRNNRSLLRSISMSVAAGAVWIVGWRKITWTKTHRDKLVAYMQHEHGFDHDQADRQTHYLLTEDAAPPDPAWFADSLKIDWADFRKWRDPNVVRAPRSAGGETYAGTYAVYTPTGGWAKRFPAADLADLDKGDVFYVEGSTEINRSREHNALLSLAGENAHLAEVPSTRLAKFKRTFPHAREARETLRTLAQAWWDGLSDEDKLACNLGDLTGDYLDADAIEDPEFAGMLRLAKRHEDLGPAYNVRSPYIGNLGDVPSADPDTFQEKYPLLPHWANETEREHATLYVNAVHRAAQKQED